MIQAINKMIRNKKGFTLVELIIVIAILGVIAAIAVPRFGGIQDEQKWKADIITATNIAKAAELYYVNENSDAANVTTLVNKYLDKNPTPSYKTTTTKNFILNSTNGVVTVTYDDNAKTALYPTPATSKP